MNEPTPANRTCSECGALIQENARVDHCPMCLLGLAITVRTHMLRPNLHAGGSEAGSAGEVFGNYELLELLGEGGMGIVYKAHQRNLDRVVALKMVRSGSLASASEIRRFRSEAKAVAQLTHPNVVAIHEVGEDNGQHFFSMEFIEGPTLAQVIRRTPLPAERAARYVKTIAEAIHYAHERGVLHRDLKPANVLIDGTDQPRVTDFGLAKQLDPELRDSNTETQGSITLSGAALGTPSYMPPEQAQGHRLQVGPASDVYSLGAILYDCLTGRPPFRADTPVDTLRQVIDTEPAAPRLLNRKVPRDLETICLKCLAKKPDQRYPSAQELADDLGRFLKHEPIQARPVGRLGRLWRWSRRKPALASLVLAVGVMFLLLDVAAFVFRNKIQGLTVFAAEKSAKILSSELKKLAAAVADVSTDSGLPRLIEVGETNALKSFLEARNKSINESGLKWMEDNPFDSWSLYDAKGVLFVRWPDAEVALENFHLHYRDHFQGATNHAPNPYISKVFRSRTDKQIVDKFGVSIAIMAGEGEQASIVGVLLATVTTSSTRTLSNFQHNADIVLVGPTDPTDGRQPWAIISHPAYKHRSEAIRIDNFPTNRQAGSSSLYFDPAASEYPLYAGPWLAGIVRIEGTHFFVIVQTRDHVTYALATAALVTVLAVLVFFGWRFVRTRTKAVRQATSK